MFSFNRSSRIPICACVLVTGTASTALAGTDVKVNSDSQGTVQNEVRIANDFFHGTLVTAYNDLVGTTLPTPIGISVSADGGVTWTDTQLSVPQDPFSPPGTPFQVIFDPFISFAPPDNVYAGYIATHPSAASASGIFIQRSVDGGMTWSGPTTIDANPSGGGGTYRFNDRPTMHVSPVGHVAVTWIKDVGVGQPTSDIYFAWSNPPPGPPPPLGTGLSFSIPTTVNDNPNGVDMANVPDVQVHPAGKTYVAWIDVDVTQANAATARIMLDSTTVPAPGHPLPPPFGTDITVRTIDPLPRHLSTTLGSADDARCGSYPVIALEHNDVTGNTIYLAYAEEHAGVDEGDIYFIRSSDGGQTWAVPVKLNDDGTTRDQFHPAIAAAPGGDICVVWYDKRNSATDSAIDVYLTHSSDGGLTWSQNIRVSDVTFSTPTNAPNTERWLGEYLGLQMDFNGIAHIAFTSGRNDQFGDIWFDKMPCNVIPADVDQNGTVNFDDVLAIIMAWGNCPVFPAACFADVNGDGVVDFDDVLEVLFNWG